VELALDEIDVAFIDHSLSYVSILVFVELALDDIVRYSDKLSEALFQSLFSWNLLLMVIF